MIRVQGLRCRQTAGKVLVRIRGPPMSSDRDELEKWVSDFLWYWQQSGMSNAEAAEIILSTLEKHLSISQKMLSSPLVDPKTIFQDRENQRAGNKTPR